MKNMHVGIRYEGGIINMAGAFVENALEFIYYLYSREHPITILTSEIVSDALKERMFLQGIPRDVLITDTISRDIDIIIDPRAMRFLGEYPEPDDMDSFYNKIGTIYRYPYESQTEEQIETVRAEGCWPRRSSRKRGNGRYFKRAADIDN